MAEVGKVDMHHRGMIAAGRRFRIVWFLNGACFIHTLLIQLESSVCLQPGRIAATKFTGCTLHAINIMQDQCRYDNFNRNPEKEGFGTCSMVFACHNGINHETCQ